MVDQTFRSETSGLPFNPLWRAIGLGTAVEIWVCGKVAEGVVIRVIECAGVRRFIVQCRHGRVLRHADEMDIVAL